MAIYLPITNPLRLWPLTELNPQTCEADYCRPQAFFPSEAVAFELVVEGGPQVLELTDAVWVDPDGLTTPAQASTRTFNGVLSGRRAVIVTVTVPNLPLCRLEFDFGAQAGGGHFRSGWVTTTADRDRLVKIGYSAYDDASPSPGEEGRVAVDTYFPGRQTEGDGYTPFIYVPGGFFTRGYAPAIDDDSYLTERYVSRYTHAYPKTSRTLTIGDARGIDNALAATVNAALCLNFEVEGRRYVRYDGAQLEALGNDALPLRAWSIALQAYDGDTAVLYGPDAWNTGADGALIDAAGLYVVDAAGNYIRANI